jgi:Zn-dependent protease
MLLGLLFQNPLVFVLLAGALIVCLSIHEWAHAYVAHRLGDDTAKHLGRVTLNPLAHLDPMGTMFLLIAGFGWGKPVPFNPYNLENPKRDSALISLAGPVSNFILAGLLAGLYHLLSAGSLIDGSVLGSVIAAFLFYAVFFNIILGTFNLIPIHPLDGFKIVNGILPDNLSEQWLQLAPYGIFLLLLMVLTRTTAVIVGPILDFFLAVLGMPRVGL